MFRTLVFSAAAFCLAAGPGLAQQPAPTPAPGQDIQLTIKSGVARRLTVAVPTLDAPGTAALQAQVTDPFTATLRSDLEYAGAFVVAESALYPQGYRDPSTQEAPKFSSTAGVPSAATRSRSRAAFGT
jgi:hypothetical protein